MIYYKSYVYKPIYYSFIGIYDFVNQIKISSRRSQFGDDHSTPFQELNVPDIKRNRRSDDAGPGTDLTVSKIVLTPDDGVVDF